MHPANKPRNVLRRVDRARQFMVNTCPASRHLHMIGGNLIKGLPYPALDEDREHCGGSILSVVESLFKARLLLIKNGIDPWTGKPLTVERRAGIERMRDILARGGHPALAQSALAQQAKGEGEGGGADG